MNNKVILVVLDGLNFQVAQENMGYLASLVESHQATLYKIQCALPSLSRPLYECLLTSKRPFESGIVNNQISRLSNQESVFSLAKDQGLVTAAASYHWMSELYNRTPYDAVRDRFTNDKTLNIQHGTFYHWDHYPDEATFLDAEQLRNSHNPDFLLVHPMNIDDAGHKFGLDSKQYRNSARVADFILSNYITTWLNAGYQLMITSDHGMNNDQTHGGTSPEEREVPLYLIGDKFSHQTCHVIQTDICGLVCQLLKLSHNKPYPPECLSL